MRAFVRYRSTVPNARGLRVGVFALTNALITEAKLTSDDLRWVRENNAWFELAYPDPGVTAPVIFDREVNPVTECWFKSSANALLERVDGYLLLLNKYEVPWERVETDDPGTVVYEDDVQVVVSVAPAER